MTADVPVPVPAPAPRSNGSTPFIVAIVAVVLAGVGAVVYVTAARPDSDNTTLIAAILGSVMTIATGLLAILKISEGTAAAARAERAAAEVKAMTKDLAVKVDGRLTQLLELTKTAFKAQGVKEGRAIEKLENPPNGTNGK